MGIFWSKPVTKEQQIERANNIIMDMLREEEMEMRSKNDYRIFKYDPYEDLNDVYNLGLSLNELSGIQLLHAIHSSNMERNENPEWVYLLPETK